ncbi:MAG: tetratricopeptide repeat protein [Burkholderiales bacterium]|jgi:tetratricopeptide (TPR) repeat protein
MSPRERRRRSWLGAARVAGVALLAFSPVACGESKRPGSAAASDPLRQRVLDFWKELNAAGAARTERDFAGAARRYEAALALDPRHEDGLYYLGQCQRELGDARAAARSFERLVEVNPLSARGHLALGALFASPDAAEPMDLARAEQHLRRAHAINGEETGPVVRLGEVALVGGRLDEARQWFESALRTNPKSVEAAFLAGYLAWESGREAAPLAARVRGAVTVEAPTKGVLSEGDRRGAKQSAAPPLTSPVGRLLFGEPIERLRAQGADGRPLSETALVRDWRAVRRLCRDYRARAASGR